MKGDLAIKVRPRPILFILPNLQGGGAERVALSVIRGIDRTKFQPILFLIKNEGVYWSEVPDDVEVVTALEPHQRVLWNLPRVFVKLSRVAHRADVLVGALELTATYLAVIAGWLLRRPAIGWVHINLRSFLSVSSYFHTKLLRWTYPYLTKVIVVSSGASKIVLELLPSLQGKISIVYNSLPLSRIYSLAQEVADAQLSGPVVMAVGRLSYQKNFDLLIRAHAKLIAQGVWQRLVILGEGAERGNLESLVHELGVQSSVSLPGFKHNPYAWMKRADVFVLSSRFEGFPMALAEAMALGVPVVSTDCPSGPTEILENGRYGLLVPPEDADALAAAIARVLTDSNLAGHLRKVGPQRAKDFGPEVIIPQFEKALLEVMR